jgi:hypothetical protein
MASSTSFCWKNFLFKWVKSVKYCVTDSQPNDLIQNGFPQILPESGKTENFGGIEVYYKETEQNVSFVSGTAQLPEVTTKVGYMNTNTEKVDLRVP